MKNNDNPRAYDDEFIAKVLSLSKWKDNLDIAKWFAHWAYEEGKADMNIIMREQLEKVINEQRAV